jgi:transcription termination factor NusB
MGMTPPGDSRAVAIGLLKEVLDRRRPLDDALAASDGFSRLDARDRAAARMLAATVLRRRGQIEGLIDDCLDHPLPYSARPVRHYLRLGVAQLLFLDVPDHAALNTTVALARAAGHDRYTGLVNAVLRRLSRDGKTMAAKQDAARLNTPDWLWQSWQATYGETVARDIAAAHLGEPPLDLSIRADARGRAGELDAEALPTGTLRRWAGGRVADLPGYADGWWWVQDAAAALPARLLSDIAGRRVIDLCAAPGGKTAQLAAAGANVVAVDKSPRRLDLLGANMKRLGLEAERVIGDATSWRPAQNPPPPGYPVAEVGRGRCRHGRNPGRLARCRGRDGPPRRSPCLLHLLAAARGRPRPDRRLAGPRRTGRTGAGAPGRGQRIGRADSRRLLADPAHWRPSAEWTGSLPHGCGENSFSLSDAGVIMTSTSETILGGHDQ